MSNKKYDLIISIKPCYVKKIIDGTKKIEFRKCIMRRKVRRIYIYETSPKMKIIGYFLYSGYDEGTPEEIWEKYSSESGLTKQEFYSYYENAERAIAIRIKNLEIFKEPLDPNEVFEDFVPPQTFKYIKLGCL